MQCLERAEDSGSAWCFACIEPWLTANEPLNCGLEGLDGLLNPAPGCHKHSMQTRSRDPWQSLKQIWNEESFHSRTPKNGGVLWKNISESLPARGNGSSRCTWRISHLSGQTQTLARGPGRLSGRVSFRPGSPPRHTTAGSSGQPIRPASYNPSDSEAWRCCNLMREC